jgi:Spy/CpxP family protein refolding chaperone
MRFRLALFLSATAATFAVGTAAASADSSYGDKAVAHRQGAALERAPAGDG